MPPGSKKRRAQKKPKPGEPPSSQGEPPELETGLEESMAKDGVEMKEGSPSPKAMDGASETMAEVVGVEEGEGLAGEASREEDEVAEVEEVSSAPEDGTRDPPGQTEVVSEVPRISESEASGENEVEADILDIPQVVPPSQIEEEKDMPPGVTVPDSEALAREINPDEEPFAELNELERVEGGTDAPPINIRSEADEDEPTAAVENEIDQAHLGSDPGLDECAVEMERIAPIAQEDVRPEDDITPDGVAAVGVDPGVDETPVADMDAAPGDMQQENNEASVADTDAASSYVEPEGTDVAPVAAAAETNEGPTSVRSEVDEFAAETQPEKEAASEILDMDPPVDAEPGMDKDPGQEEVEAGAPSGSTEPEAKNDASSETAAETDEVLPDVQSEMEAAADQRLLETDAAPINLEAESELEQEAAQVGEDVPIDEIDREVEPVPLKIQSQTEASEGENEASSLVAPDAVEPEPGMTLREPEVDATLDDTEKEEVDETENKSEVSAMPINEEQDEGPVVAPTPESENNTSREAEGGMEVKNTSLEAEADAVKEIESEPERPGDTPQVMEEAVTDPVSLELEVEGKTEAGTEALTESAEASDVKELNEGLETPVEDDTIPKEVTNDEVELVDDTKPANGALTEAAEVSDSKEGINRGVETPMEADTKLDGEAETEIPEPEPELDFPSESKPDQEGSKETESGQQDLIEIDPDQPYIQDQDQHTELLERETDSGVEGRELPVSEANKEVSLPVFSMSEAGSVEYSAPSASEGESPPIADTSVPVDEQQMLDEAGVVSSPEEVLQDEADAADTEVVLQSEEGAIDEQLDEPKECIIQQESTGADDVMDQEEAPSGEVDRSAVPTKQDSETEQHPTINVDEEVALIGGTHEAETESSLDKQDLTIDPQAMDVSSGESEMVEEGLSTTLPPESEVAVNEDKPEDEVTFEQEQNFDSPSALMERDIGEEETALSTVAEAGSVVNDFDESASYQQLPTDFSSSEQDAEISESREADDTLSRTPKVIVTDLIEDMHNEAKESDEPSSPTVPELIGEGLTKQEGGERADSFGDDGKVSLEAARNYPDDEVEWKAVQDLEPTADHEDSAKVEDPATILLESHIELPVDVLFSEERDVPDNEINIVEAGGGDGGTAPPIFGIEPAIDSLALAKEELMPKILPNDTNGLGTLPISDASMYDHFPLGEEGGGNQDNSVANVKPEIYTSEAKGEVMINESNGSSLLSDSPGQDIEDVQAFHQQKTQEASLPVVVPAQDVKQRALEQGNFQGNYQHPSKGGTLQHRSNLLGCCGLIDVLLGKNK
ncbi:hypothetical protein GOP47_0028692 [Adiantum capillus-veneris]|nr:hypothetical protein GOP47_0028128 [Adiantum capillus-veneris]KAI5056874.1 hypothetical protein GOP47_0028692 [Adiantum capillus-veneris]